MSEAVKPAPPHSDYPLHARDELQPYCGPVSTAIGPFEQNHAKVVLYLVQPADQV